MFNANPIIWIIYNASILCDFHLLSNTLDSLLMWQHCSVVETITFMNSHWDVWYSWPLNLDSHFNCWSVVPLIFLSNPLRSLCSRRKSTGVGLPLISSVKSTRLMKFLIRWGYRIPKPLSLGYFGLFISIPK